MLNNCIPGTGFRGWQSSKSVILYRWELDNLSHTWLFECQFSVGIWLCRYTNM